MSMFPTVSFHPVKPCNMACKYCFATFQDFKVGKQLDLAQTKTIIDKLHMAGVQKITFAGGEPMLFKQLVNAIRYTKELDITTSIITNGALIRPQFLDKMQDSLDWIGLSIDSLDDPTNVMIGRVHKGQPITEVGYRILISMIKRYGYKLKINTVVNSYNEDEDMQEFINWANPDRWKVFDALRVREQNDEHWEEIKSTQFKQFVARHKHPNMVVETNDLMTSSYLLIDPLGRLFEDTKGIHTYSDSLLDHSMEHCLSQINLNMDMFIKRGGIYEW